MATDKHELRAEMRALRKRLAESTPDAADRAAVFVSDLPTGPMVAVYRAIGAEFDPEPLTHVLILAGRSICLPVAIQRDAPLIFRRWSPGEPL
ncbi:MAG: 5-formyltetrahydrofolate cyclo-ligase, partial [Brevundimonas sp.]|nr:5-formyltetrahydrofolate cyclo-ligase [Brevundimonas sp.]